VGGTAAAVLASLHSLSQQPQGPRTARDGTGQPAQPPLSGYHKPSTSPGRVTLAKIQNEGELSIQPETREQI